jgi:hypothetical protein
VSWAYQFDPALKLPYQDNLSALIHEPSFKQTAGEAVFSKVRGINTLGHRAVHSHRPVPEADALAFKRHLPDASPVNLVTEKDAEGRVFFLFDYCQNLQYFSQNVATTDGSAGDSLGKRLFNARLDLIGQLDAKSLQVEADTVGEAAPAYGEPKTDGKVRQATFP